MIFYLHIDFIAIFRYAYANAFSRFSEAILDYLANIDNTPDPSVTKEHFVSEIDAAHEVLFSIWMNGKGMSLTNSSQFDAPQVVILCQVELTRVLA